MKKFVFPIFTVMYVASVLFFEEHWNFGWFIGAVVLDYIINPIYKKTEPGDIEEVNN